MQWCLDCHRNPEMALRPLDQVYNMDWKAPGNQAELGAKFAQERKIRTTVELTVARPVIVNGRHERSRTRFNQDNHPPTAEESALREYPLDLAAADAKAKSGSGKQYWRSIEELAGDPHFEDLLHREFPRAASEWDESVDRRDFLN